MSKASEALTDVRRWLCDKLSDGEAGKVCGMLSVVSRHINELEDENAKLREQGERLFDKTLELGTENAKLRELVRAFWWCTENFDMPCKCDRCPLGQSDKLTPECEARMRELGVLDE